VSGWEELGVNAGLPRSLDDARASSLSADRLELLLVRVDVAASVDPSASPAQSAPVSATVAAVALIASPRRVRRAGCRRRRRRGLPSGS
jgi:hypothetical protein